MTNLEKELESIEEMYKKGIILDEESYIHMKKEIMNQIEIIKAEEVSRSQKGIIPPSLAQAIPPITPPLISSSSQIMEENYLQMTSRSIMSVMSEDDIKKCDEAMFQYIEDGNIERVALILTPFAEQGYASIQINLAINYELEGDYINAAKWYQKAAEQGDDNAIILLNKLKADNKI